MKTKDLLKKIEELEARIRQLEARPSGETHHHYHHQQPSYQQLPSPFVYPSITYGCSG
jgi:BMFP domain-containing protein YqiC